jgi:hypothetical protein
MFAETMPIYTMLDECESDWSALHLMSLLTNEGRRVMTGAHCVSLGNCGSTPAGQWVAVID